MTLESDLEAAMARTNDFTVVLALVSKFKLDLATSLEVAAKRPHSNSADPSDYYWDLRNDIDPIIAELRK